MTSLQRAAAPSKKLETTKKGAFESSFAAGLDLSEFDSSTTTCTRMSAAAELLQIKALEAQQAAREEHEEIRIQKLAKIKGQELTDAASTLVLTPPRHEAPHESQSATTIMEEANMSATLIHLHREDINGAHHKAKLGRKGKMSLEKSMRRNRLSHMQQSSGGTKKGAMKKSRRSKY
mmetsp:Transcript_18574/g.33644  ORF Transcript_18574/g.33644 Transcript_18574/m.33644 type:complete len:177 (+) Transcript_18574:95-625(+)